MCTMSETFEAPRTRLRPPATGNETDTARIAGLRSAIRPRSGGSSAATPCGPHAATPPTVRSRHSWRAGRRIHHPDRTPAARLHVGRSHRRVHLGRPADRGVLQVHRRNHRTRPPFMTVAFDEWARRTGRSRGQPSFHTPPPPRSRAPEGTDRAPRPFRWGASASGTVPGREAGRDSKGGASGGRSAPPSLDTPWNTCPDGGREQATRFTSCSAGNTPGTTRWSASTRCPARPPGRAPGRSVITGGEGAATA